MAGDGTTTATVLAQALVDEGLRNVTAGVNPQVLRRGLEKGLDILVEEISHKIAQPISGNEIEKVATVSANDEKIGQIIAQAMQKVGENGVITVEEGQTFGVTVDVVEGMQFDKGYASPYMVTNQERMEAEYNEPYILITDKKITAIQDILPLLEKIATTGKKELVIIAEEIEGEALATLVVNKMRGTFNALAIKAPGFGDRRKAILEDIAVLTGGQVITEELGLKLETVELDVLGRAGKIITKKDQTVIVDGQGDKKLLKNRVEFLQKQLKEIESDYEKEKIQERIAKMSGGVAVIKVGAATETEMKEKKDRIDDAVSATKAAVEEGIVAGGGTTFIRALKALDKVEVVGEEKIAFDILRHALEAPLWMIAQNAGQEGSVVVDKVKNNPNGFGFNALTDEYQDLVKVGVIDPAKVTRSALQNAVSIAIMILTTEASITDLPKKGEDASSSAGAGLGDGMGMY